WQVDRRVTNSVCVVTRMLYVAELVLVSLRDCADTGVGRAWNLLEIPALVAVKVRDLRVLAAVADEDLIARADASLMHAERRESPDVRVDRHLEDVPEEVRVDIGRIDRNGFAGLRREELGRIALERARHQLREDAQQLAEARTRLGRDEADRDQVPAAKRALERIVQLLERDLRALLEIELHQLVVELDHAVHDLGVRGLDAREIGRLVRRLEEAVGDRLASSRGKIDRQALRTE